jgi:general secretion pathway protein E
MPAHVALFRKVISGPSGLILIAGKTNSGKTQILAAGLDEISSERSVHTLEDPTEFSLGIPQTFVNHDQVVIADNKSAKTVSFAMYSRYLLRHDVDVEMHSELRDHAGAMEACRKGETGQIVLASLHCSSAVGIAPTMINQFKVEPSVVASPDLMRLWIYQTLVRTLCSNCKIDSDEALKSYTGKDLEELKVAIAQLKKERIELAPVRFKNLKGCSCCKNTGEKGRTALVEMILISNEDREFLEQSKYLAWSMHLEKKGYKTVRDHALYKISEGLMDIRTAATKVNDLLPVTADSFYSQLGFNTSAVKPQPRRTRPARPARTETPLQLEGLSA